LAGVASKHEQDGIKVYKEQTSYNKWEFVYDITKDPARGAGAAPPVATPPNGAPGQNVIPAQTNITVPGSAAAQIVPPVAPPAQAPVTQPQ
jgi:hypothetical protein